VHAERKPTVFVCGPFTNALEAGLPEEHPRLDEDLAAFLNLIHETIERHQLTVASAHREELAGPHQLTRPQELTPEVIAKRDRAWMQHCDAAVIVLGTPSRSCWRTDGTFIELGWASAFGRPVVLVGDLDAYPSALVRGVPSLLPNSLVLAPERLQERPALLIDALDRVANHLALATRLALPAEEALLGEQGRAMGPVGQP
jgi:nucleoside 2-deoxyribosyltransferase